MDTTVTPAVFTLTDEPTPVVIQTATTMPVQTRPGVIASPTLTTPTVGTRQPEVLATVTSQVPDEPVLATAETDAPSIPTATEFRTPGISATPLSPTQTEILTATRATKATAVQPMDTTVTPAVFTLTDEPTPDVIQTATTMPIQTRPGVIASPTLTTPTVGTRQPEVLATSTSQVPDEPVLASAVPSIEASPTVIGLPEIPYSVVVKPEASGDQFRAQLYERTVRRIPLLPADLVGPERPQPTGTSPQPTSDPRLVATADSSITEIATPSATLAIDTPDVSATSATAVATLPDANVSMTAESTKAATLATIQTAVRATSAAATQAVEATAPLITATVSTELTQTVSDDTATSPAVSETVGAATQTLVLANTSTPQPDGTATATDVTVELSVTAPAATKVDAPPVFSSPTFAPDLLDTATDIPSARETLTPSATETSARLEATATGVGRTSVTPIAEASRMPGAPSLTDQPTDIAIDSRAITPSPTITRESAVAITALPTVGTPPPESAASETAEVSAATRIATTEPSVEATLSITGLPAMPSTEIALVVLPMTSGDLFLVQKHERTVRRIPLTAGIPSAPDEPPALSPSPQPTSDPGETATALSSMAKTVTPRVTVTLDSPEASATLATAQATVSDTALAATAELTIAPTQVTDPLTRATVTQATEATASSVTAIPSDRTTPPMLAGTATSATIEAATPKFTPTNTSAPRLDGLATRAVEITDAPTSETEMSATAAPLVSPSPTLSTDLTISASAEADLSETMTQSAREAAARLEATPTAATGQPTSTIESTTMPTQALAPTATGVGPMSAIPPTEATTLPSTAVLTVQPTPAIVAVTTAAPTPTLIGDTAVSSLTPPSAETPLPELGLTATAEISVTAETATVEPSLEVPITETSESAMPPTEITVVIMPTTSGDRFQLQRNERTIRRIPLPMVRLVEPKPPQITVTRDAASPTPTHALTEAPTLEAESTVTPSPGAATAVASQEASPGATLAPATIDSATAVSATQTPAPATDARMTETREVTIGATKVATTIAAFATATSAPTDTGSYATSDGYGKRYRATIPSGGVYTHGDWRCTSDDGDGDWRCTTMDTAEPTILATEPAEITQPSTTVSTLSATADVQAMDTAEPTVLATEPAEITQPSTTVSTLTGLRCTSDGYG